MNLEHTADDTKELGFSIERTGKPSEALGGMAGTLSLQSLD